MASGGGGDVSAVYTSVIDDVVAKVRKEFLNHGLGDGVLTQLRALWEAKMVHCGALSGTTAPAPGGGGRATPPAPPSYDEGYYGYATPTAEMLFPPTPIPTPIRTPLRSPISGMRNDGAVKEEEGAERPKFGRPSPYYVPPSPFPARPLGADVDIAYQESLEDPDTAPRTRDFLTMCPGKRKRGDDEFPGQRSSASALPQQDESADQTVEFFLPHSSEGNAAQELWDSIMDKRGSTPSVKETTRTARVIPQLDGVQGDGYYDYQYFFPGGVSTEDYDDDEPPLNEDDDDDDEDELKDSEPNAQHLVLAQFDKVSRTKNRWRCSLKDGIMHLNGREILFKKASGEFDF
ncbi:hypothetical protein BRADI_4g05469v3 [Brachypodium distachyon]|uniref:Transcription factor IIA alpha/beta subunit n=1 Tax=Brachypodium distachyon TaxID=15368 RepID=A0A0Q3EJ58_BRADI|nr:hypothetical protein BRADI_4g05469v3 [Brachypodium distachyon]